MGLLVQQHPQKVECLELRCHPDDEASVRAAFDAPIVVDARVTPGMIVVTPYAIAEHIDVTIGFQDPNDRKWGG
jgi:hypothetical protein